MIIERLTYAKLFNLGHYENERLEAVALLEPHEDPILAMQQLRLTVEAQHDALLEDRRQEAEDAERRAHYQYPDPAEPPPGVVMKDAEEMPF